MSQTVCKVVRPTQTLIEIKIRLLVGGAWCDACTIGNLFCLPNLRASTGIFFATHYLANTASKSFLLAITLQHQVYQHTRTFIRHTRDLQPTPWAKHLHLITNSRRVQHTKHHPTWRPPPPLPTRSPATPARSPSVAATCSARTCNPTGTATT
jgi:hypothetical protein